MVLSQLLLMKELWPLVVMLPSEALLQPAKAPLREVGGATVHSYLFPWS